jgi:hypothetical protein
MPTIETTPEALKGIYEKMRKNVQIVKGRLNGRPLTLAEKILFGHLDKPETQELDPGKAYLYLRPDRVIMQDATAQMAILQFMQAGVFQTAVPSSVHCDHLIQAYQGAGKDTESASVTNKEVYDFLSSAASKYGMPRLGHHPPGGAGELRGARRVDDRLGLPHPQRGRPRHGGHRRGRRGHRGRDGRLPLGAVAAQADRREADR